MAGLWYVFLHWFVHFFVLQIWARTFKVTYQIQVTFLRMGGILLVVDFGMGLSCIDAIDVILSDWPDLYWHTVV